MKQMPVIVHFFSGSNASVTIENYTTIRNLKAAVMNKIQFNVSKIPYYGIYEVCNCKDRSEERFLDDDDRVVDILSIWTQEEEEQEKKKENADLKLYMKIFLYYPYSDGDVDTVTQVYYESFHDFLQGKFNLTEKEIITLASLHLLIQFGSSQDNAYHSIQKNLDSYVPVNKKNLNPANYWIQHIMELYSGLNATSKLEAKLTFIERLKTNHLWEGHQFNAKVNDTLIKFSAKNTDNPDNLPEEIVLNIKTEGIAVLDVERVIPNYFNNRFNSHITAMTVLSIGVLTTLYL